jgi:O-acetyl-ADP-ribose deacetylase (regulator of RNase III)
MTAPAPSGPNVQPQVGNLFASGAQTLVNTVNTVGVMGKGIAAQFKERFPDMYRDYVAMCELGRVKLGRPYLWVPTFGQWVLNFPTKDHWRSSARLSDIVEGLEHLEAEYQEWGIRSLAVPPLGCGEGGLEWRVVGPTLYQHLSRLDIPVELFAPFGTPPDQLAHNFLGAPINSGAAGSLKLSPSAVALAEIVGRVTSERHHYPIGRIGFQKIAYFATQAGLPTGLRFSESSYGPFAPDMKRLKSRLENNGVLAERQLGQMLAAVPGPTFDDARKAYAAWLERWEDIIDRVADLFMRLRTTRQAEIAATVHFAATEVAERRGRRPTETEVLAYVRGWKARRQPPIEDEEFGLAIRNLNAAGWLDADFSADLPLPEHEREPAFA